MRHRNFLSSPEVSTLVRAGLWLAVLAAAVWFLTRIQMTLTIFGLAWLIAYLTRPVVRLLEGRRLGPIHHCPRGLAVGALYLVIGAFLVLAGSLLFPAVTSQFNRLLALQDTLYHPAELAQTVQHQGEMLIARVPEQYREQLLERLRASAGSISLWLGKALTGGLTQLGAFLGQLAAGAAIFVSALLISIYLMLSWEALYQSFVGAIPPKYRGDCEQLLTKMNQIFGGYLRATIITSAVNGLCTLIALWLTSLVTGRSSPYAYLIALVAAITYPIPLFGVLAAVAAGLVLGFIPDNNFTTALIMAGVVFVVNIIIDRTLQPKLMGDAIGVSPMFVIFAAAAGGEFLGGVWGMLLGIPLAAMTKAFFTWFHDLFLVDPREAPLEPAPGQIPDSAHLGVVPTGVAPTVIPLQAEAPVARPLAPVAAAPATNAVEAVEPAQAEAVEVEAPAPVPAAAESAPEPVPTPVSLAAEDAPEPAPAPVSLAAEDAPEPAQESAPAPVSAAAEGAPEPAQESAPAEPAPLPPPAGAEQTPIPPSEEPDTTAEGAAEQQSAATSESAATTQSETQSGDSEADRPEPADRQETASGGEQPTEETKKAESPSGDPASPPTAE